WVLTPLPVQGALVAADAVAVARLEKAAETASAGQVLRKRSADLPGLATASHVAVLPAGGVAYLSGQPEKGEPVPAAKKSLETLLAMLGQMGLGPEHVVQVKVFLGPMEQAETVQKELVALWGKQVAPPMSIIQWKSSAPVEIELVAADPPKPDETVEKPVHYYNPPGVEASPRFSRAARVRSNKILYIGTLASPEPAKGDKQVEAIFARLEKILQANGSDLRHLVKATYYCGDAASSKALDAIRSKIFDPKRPPAASKAMVSGVAIPDRTVVVDMIAVPKQ
ncbi:MAG TPA: RidA family protein, partial [Thermoguttaceae bacterium]|nr:RidA family protein [Thermoguttaceae bacterium]